MSEVAEIALFTDDVEAVKAFYGDLLAAEPEAEWPGGAIFAAGSAKLLVHERGAALEDGPPNEDHFAVSVRDPKPRGTSCAREGSRFSSIRATTRGDARHISVIPTAAWSSSARRSS